MWHVETEGSCCHLKCPQCSLVTDVNVWLRHNGSHTFSSVPDKGATILRLYEDNNEVEQDLVVAISTPSGGAAISFQGVAHSCANSCGHDARHTGRGSG